MNRRLELTCFVSTPRRVRALQLKVLRTGQCVTARVSGDVSVRWQLQFAGAQTVTAQDGARTTPDPLGIILQPAEGSQQLEFDL
jgi:hypothetical protein